MSSIPATALVVLVTRDSFQDGSVTSALVPDSEETTCETNIMLYLQVIYASSQSAGIYPHCCICTYRRDTRLIANSSVVYGSHDLACSRPAALVLLNRVIESPEIQLHCIVCSSAPQQEGSDTMILVVQVHDNPSSCPSRFVEFSPRPAQINICTAVSVCVVHPAGDRLAFPRVSLSTTGRCATRVALPHSHSTPSAISDATPCEHHGLRVAHLHHSPSAAEEEEPAAGSASAFR